MARLEANIQETLVLLIEVLRKLEIRFAIGRVGAADNARLLKPFDEPFSPAVGQRLLESFSFNEGSYPASGLCALSKKVFSPLPASHRSYRAVIMVTDGLTSEARDAGAATEANFLQPARELDFRLSMLQLKSAGTGDAAAEAFTEESLRAVCQRSRGVHASLVASREGALGLPQTVAQLLMKTIAKMAEIPPARPSSATPGAAAGAESAARASPERGLRPLLLPAADIPATELELLSGMLGRVKSLEEAITAAAGVPPSELFDASVAGAAEVPFAQAVCLPASGAAAAARRALESARRDVMEAASAANLLRPTRIASACPSAPTLAAAQWASAERTVAKCAEELCAVFEECVMPHNRFTRRKADLKGALWPPGLMKGIATEWRYRKIYSTKTSGGKRDYSICLALDTSLSMEGVLQCCAVESLVAVISALGMLGFDKFSVIVFGSQVTLVKAEDQPWDSAAVHGLAAALSHRSEAPGHSGAAAAAATSTTRAHGAPLAVDAVCGTADADAIEYGLHQLRNSGSRGPKKMWVFTDGYTSCGKRLTEALVSADEDGIEVVGLAVGPDRTFTSDMYQHWVRAAMPNALPSALRALYSREAGHSPAKPQADGMQQRTPLWARMRVGDSDTSDSSIEAVLGSMQCAFPDLAAKFERTRELKLVRGNQGGLMQVDVAFVLDVTGSMEPWLEAVKEQLKAIMRDIRPKFAKKWPDVPILLRFAVLPYRDTGDAEVPPFDFVPLPALPAGDPEAVKAAMDAYCADAETKVLAYVRGLRATGGGDQAEDVLGALERTATRLSWEGRVRLAVVLADAPCHGANFHAADITDSRPDEAAATAAAKKALRALDASSVDTMFCHVKRDATRLMEERLRAICASLTRPDGSQIDPSRRLLKPLDLFRPGEGGEVRQAMHLVFVLDESGSMSGSPWAALMAAYKSFLDVRGAANQGRSEDKVSVVLFNSDARTPAKCVPIAEVDKSFSMRGHGTNFGPALDAAKAALDATPAGYSPLLLFMSDGCGSGGEAQMASIYTTHARQGLQVHSIAFGSADQGKLRLLAETGHGTFHVAPDPTSLQATFTRIAAAAGAADGLIAQFAQYVTDNLTDKLVMEYM
ncbi:hypothetical protein FNF31_08020 [Cafeteria roenbergensis]|nr:hypothetical protein FNF31_08020 [Cafeteria roenbergensis]